MKDMCSQIRSHRVSPCDHRAMTRNHRTMTRWHVHTPRAVSWSHRVLPLNHRAIERCGVNTPRALPVETHNHVVVSWNHRVLPWTKVHRVLPWTMYFCPFRACINDIVFAAPKALPWAREAIGLSARSCTPTRPGYARPERAMSSIAQGNALGICTHPRIVALKGQKYTAQGNALWFKGNALRARATT